jgi:hypothetical protein
MNALKKIAAALVLLAGLSSAAVGGSGPYFGSWELNEHIYVGTPPPAQGYNVATSIDANGAWFNFQLLCESGEYQAEIYGHNKIKNDTLMIGIDGKKPRAFNASTKDEGLVTKISKADLDWFADSQSTIRITLPTSRREFVFSVKETRKAVAVLKEACKIP